MALASSSAARKRLLPSSIETGLKRLAWWCVGATLIVMALAAWASLATWSMHDPSLNHATREAPANLLAYWGAVTADLSLQSLGLAAIFLFLPLAAWGWHISSGSLPERAKMRLAAWPLGVILIAGGLSSLPEPDAWPLPNGFGGIMGDLTLAVIKMILAPLPEILLRGIAALGFLAAGGAAMLFASGITSHLLKTLRGAQRVRTASSEFIILAPWIVSAAPCVRFFRGCAAVHRINSPHMLQWMVMATIMQNPITTSMPIRNSTTRCQNSFAGNARPLPPTPPAASSHSLQIPARPA